MSSSNPASLPDNQPSSSSKKQASTSFACDSCRTARVRCDRVRPRCGRCVGLKETCVYASQRQSKAQRRIRDLESQLQDYQDMLRTIATAKVLPPEMQSAVDDLLDQNFATLSRKSSMIDLDTDSSSQRPLPTDDATFPFDADDALTISSFSSTSGKRVASSSTAIAYDVALQQRIPVHALDHQAPDHSIPCLTVYGDSVVSRIFFNYREVAMQMIERGVPLRDVYGSDSVDVELLFRERQPYDKFSMCSFASELFHRFPDVDLVVRLAWVALTKLLLRWMLFPTPRNYEALPAIIEPLKLQKMVPHSPLIDLCPLPALRHALLQRPGDQSSVVFDLMRRTAIDWPGGVSSAVELDPETGNRRLTLEFIAFATLEQNWILDESVLYVFPELGQTGMQTRSLFPT